MQQLQQQLQHQKEQEVVTQQQVRFDCSYATRDVCMEQQPTALQDVCVRNYGHVQRHDQWLVLMHTGRGYTWRVEGTTSAAHFS